MFWPNFLLLLLFLVVVVVVVVVPGCCLLLLLFLVVAVVPGCCLLLFVPGACWCLLVPVGACWCWCLVPVGGACWWLLFVCVVGVQDFGESPPDPPPSPGPPKISLFFFSPAGNFFLSFFLSLGVLSLNFGGVFEGRNPEMCTFGLSGCRVEPRRPHQTGPPGLHTTARELQTRTFERPGASNTTKIPRENPQREKKE